jgi:hypothetical protein
MSPPRTLIKGLFPPPCDRRCFADADRTMRCSSARDWSPLSAHLAKSPNRLGLITRSLGMGSNRLATPFSKSVVVSLTYFGLSAGLTKLRPLGPVPLTCRTVSSSISM